MLSILEGYRYVAPFLNPWASYLLSYLSRLSPLPFMPQSSGMKVFGVDVALAAYLTAWYIGNYMYNIVNKRLLNFTGGAAGVPAVAQG